MAFRGANVDPCRGLGRVGVRLRRTPYCPERNMVEVSGATWTWRASQGGVVTGRTWGWVLKWW